jgi:hypothetical protein
MILLGRLPSKRLFTEVPRSMEFSEVHPLKICYPAYKKWATWRMRMVPPTFIIS